MATLSGFAEAAALEVPSELSMFEPESDTNSEPRNRSWREALFELTRHRRLSNYHYYGDVWAPKDLKRGDIVRCNLPTDYANSGAPKLNPRNCIFMGFELDPETLEPVAARLARLSYNIEERNDEFEPYWPSADRELRKHIIAGFYKPVVVRTGSPVDIVPFSGIYWGHFIDVQGTIKPSYFPQLERDMAKGYEYSRRHITPRNYAELPPGQTLSTPSLDPAHHTSAFALRLDDPIGSDFFDIEDPQQRSAILVKLAENQLSRTLGRQLQMDIEKGLRKTFAARILEEEDTVRRSLSELRRHHNSLRAQDMARIMEIAGELIEQRDELAAQDLANTLRPELAQEITTEQRRRVADIPSIDDLIAASFEKWRAENDSTNIMKGHLDRRTQADGSIEKLASLGIGGLIREPAVHLPEYLWRGRYLMLRLPDLLDEDAVSDSTNRPCVLRRLWVRPNDDGAPTISHIEVHPCTRGQAHNFQYKMKVRPLETTVPTPTFLIAEMSIILEVTANNLQPNQPVLGNFYELLPHQVDELEERRFIAERALGKLKSFGLKEDQLPADCVEIILPNPPDEKVRAKLVQWGAARFVSGHKAPDKRPMHARPRNFDGRKIVSGWESRTVRIHSSDRLPDPEPGEG